MTEQIQLYARRTSGEFVPIGKASLHESAIGPYDATDLLAINEQPEVSRTILQVAVDAFHAYANGRATWEPEQAIVAALQAATGYQHDQHDRAARYQQLADAFRDVTNDSTDRMTTGDLFELRELAVAHSNYLLVENIDQELRSQAGTS